MSDQNQSADTGQAELKAVFEIDGTTYTGRVVSMADGAIVVAYGDGLVRSMPLPTPVRIGISGENLSREVVSKASVRQWLRDGDADCLRITISEEQFALLESSAFPQRPERTPVRGSKAIRVEVCPLEGEAKVEAALVDISDSGVAVILSSKDDLALAGFESKSNAKDSWSVKTSLTLPGNESKLQFIGELCYRMYTRKCIKYGIRFDLEASEAAFPGEQLSIQDHIDWFRKSADKAA